MYLGRSGSLDHVFANTAAKPLLAGVTSWAVNAQESIAFEYSRAGMNAHLAVEAEDPYRSSDHNPEIIGLNLLGAGPSPGTNPTPSTSSVPGSAPSPSAGALTPRGTGSPATSSSRGRRKNAGNSRRMTPANARASLARTGVDAAAPLWVGVLLALAGIATRSAARRGSRHP